jgi:hypothetical protein
VNVLIQEILSLLEELPCEDHRGGGSVADLIVLGLGDLDHHLGGGVLDIDLFEHGGAVVGDGDVPEAVDEHLVHAPRPQGRLEHLGDDLRRSHVRLAGVATTAPLSPFLQNQHGLSGQICHIIILQTRY